MRPQNVVNYVCAVAPPKHCNQGINNGDINMFYTNLEEHRARLRYMEIRAEKERAGREIAQINGRNGLRKAVGRGMIYFGKQLAAE